MNHMAPKITREDFIEQYANIAGISIKEVMAFKDIIPATLDRTDCDYPQCGGWHAIPKNVYTQEDVRSGFIKQALLDYIQEHL